MYDKPWKGEAIWVAWMTGGGFIIGCIKAVPCFHIPAKADGLFAEVKDKHVDPKEAPGILTISCLSLLFGFRYMLCMRVVSRSHLPCMQTRGGFLQSGPPCYWSAMVYVLSS